MTVTLLLSEMILKDSFILGGSYHTRAIYTKSLVSIYFSDATDIRQNIVIDRWALFAVEQTGI